jgi:nucleotide-binding universal stress UspA family protein
MPYEAMMVHLDAERDSEQRVQLALDLAHRFQAALIGVAGWALKPAFVAGGFVVYSEPSPHDLQQMTGQLDRMGKTFLTQGQNLKHVEWRSALDSPSELVLREARAADLVIVGPRHAQPNLRDVVDPGVILLRAGRPVLVVPEITGPLGLHRVVIAWKDSRECRRAVRDALPFLQRAKEVLIVEMGEAHVEAEAKKRLSDVKNYLIRHRVITAREIWHPTRGPESTELLHFARDEKADLIVAGGYGHTRLGEWIFGGVTHELLTTCPVCCMLSH